MLRCPVDEHFIRRSEKRVSNAAFKSHGKRYDLSQFSHQICFLNLRFGGRRDFSLVLKQHGTVLIVTL